MQAAVSSPFLNRKQAAEYLGVAEQTLSVWACTKRYNLPYRMHGRKAMYRLADLEKFSQDRTVDVGGEQS